MGWQPLHTRTLPGIHCIAPLPPIRLLDGSLGRSAEALSLATEWQATRDSSCSSNEPYPAEQARLADGSSVTGWRAGWSNVAAGGQFLAGWDQDIPALSSLAGINTFTLTTVDVTPAPWNQPPYPASGDEATANCTLSVALP